MKNSFIILAFFLAGLTANGQSDALWLRNPAISPDGNAIVFGYKGDLYKVGASGGNAYPITLHEAHDMNPVWSPDGKFIAFASNRFGNFDVFIMPTAGGEPVRLTYFSGNDVPSAFTPEGKEVIFNSARMMPASSVRFYSGLFHTAYKVSVNGGRALPLTAAGAKFTSMNSKGDKLVFEDTKGYEDNWRKHHTSSVTKDIWLYDIKSGKYEKISNFAGEDREPVFSRDDESVYYLSEKNGSLNIIKHILNGGADTTLSTFDKHPVRSLSISNNNTLAYTYDGSIYVQREGSSPQKLSVQILNDGRGNYVQNRPIGSGMSEFLISPNGKEIAFVNRGEVFVTAVDAGTTKRITNTPQQERMLSWGKDGKSLYYSAERNGNWDIYEATIVRKEEPYFYASTLLKETQVIATEADEFQPLVSPDGKEIAYLEDRNVLKILNVESKKSRTIMPAGNNYSYADGDQYFTWSPDSKYLLVDDQQGYWLTSNAGLYKVDGSQKPVYPIRSGFGEGAAKISMDGKVLTWMSARNGRSGPALQSSRELDIYAVFLDQDTYDRFTMNKDDFSLLEEIEKKDSTKAKRDSLGKKNWQPNFDNLDLRKLRLTMQSGDLSDYYLKKDGSKLWYLARGDKGYDLYELDTRKKETKVLASLGGSPSGLEVAKDEKALFVLNNGKLVKIDEAGKSTPVTVNGEMQIDAAAERAYIFDHAWRQVRGKFYDPKLHGVDWNMYKTAYAKFLPHINNNFDFQELLSELLGELNASHTGGYYNPQPENPDQTVSLGIIPDQTYTGAGIKVDEVIGGGPFDRAQSKIRAGIIIEKIDGEAIDANVDFNKYLNRKAGAFVLVSMYDPVARTRWDEVVKPIELTQEYRLMYNRWVKQMEAYTDSISHGRIGYLHVQGMNDGSFREVIDRALGRNMGKEALVVDTRFNGGGWLHDELNTFLSGNSYLHFAPQGNKVKASEPSMRWSKPSIVVMSESNYSDAFIFPYIYKQNGIGKLVGMPVPGTGTAVWWESQIDPTLVFGIPMVATIGKEGRATENLQLNPDIMVPLKYEEFLKGKDAQIEAAVKELLKDLGSKK